jgi:hypothetical protein
MAFNSTPLTEGDNQAALEQLRELLYGESLRRLEQRVTALERALEAAATAPPPAALPAASGTPANLLFQERLEHLHERLVQLRLETAQRDEQLHAELLALLNVLERSPASRQELARLLLDLGQRLQSRP